MRRSFFLFLVALSPLLADEFDLPPTKPPSATEPLDANRAKIGSVLVDADKGEVSFHGKIVSAIRELEVFASAPQGRTYEGVIVCDAEPIDVETGLKLLGLEGGGGVKFQGDSTAPHGDPVDVLIEWTDPKSGKKKSARAEDFVVNEKTGKPLPHFHWVHVGSRWNGKRFNAQVMGDIIALEHFPDAILDNPLEIARNDFSYVVSELVPPAGTELTLILKVVKPKADEKPAATDKPRRGSVEKKGLR